MDKPYIENSLNVDASFLWKKRIMEWQVKDTMTGEVLVRNKMPKGTCNMAEFMAIVDAIKYQKQENIDIPIYSDSLVAIRWVKNKICNSVLELDNVEYYDLIDDTEDYLKSLGDDIPEILKWKTKEWGEIPSDFGRK